MPAVPESASDAPRVLLVLPPWAFPYYPGLPVALLRSILLRDGIACDILYANLIFSKMIADQPFFEQNVGRGAIAELVFTPFYFDKTRDEAARELHEYFAYDPELVTEQSSIGVELFEELIDRADAFLDRCVDAVDWSRYDVVGFSLMFQQTLSSLAIAQRVKKAHPHLEILFGGASCADPMGEEMMRCFPEIDYVSTGESDGTIAPLIREIREHPEGPFETPGVVWRDAEGRVRNSGKAPAFAEIDTQPIPDYTPYFEQYRALGITHFEPMLYIETARGCWWGQKSHCRFCGIDDDLMSYRSKSAEHVLEEIVTMSRRHGLTHFWTADEILNFKFYKTLLPELKRLREEEGFDFTFFFEMKSNVTREQVELLHEAGIVRVQPGIESLSDNVLKLMGKGASGIQQLQALRYLSEYGIPAVWNIIFQNPFEKPADYWEMVRLIPFMHHLPPLRQYGEVQMLLQRFNPYFENPDEYGIRDVRPREFYHRIFPRDDIDHHKLAFFFDYDRDWEHKEELDVAYEALVDACQQWRDLYVPDALTQTRGPGFTQIVDRRRAMLGEGGPDVHVITLTGLAHELLAYCDQVRRRSLIDREFDGRATADEIDAVLDDLIAQRLVYRSADGAYLSLPLLKSRTAVPQHA